MGRAAAGAAGSGLAELRGVRYSPIVHSKVQNTNLHVNVQNRPICVETPVA
jgi:hypothetical protein